MLLKSATTRTRPIVALGALLLLTFASTATAAVTRSQITTPGDPFFAIANDANSTEERTVSGTTDGTSGDVVDLYCTANGTYWSPSPGQNIAVQSDGSFSGTVDLFDISDNESGCILRAVPDGETPSNTSPFRGPRMLVTYWQGPESQGNNNVHGGGTVKDDIYGNVTLLRGDWYVYEVDDDPLYDGGPTNPTTLFNTPYYNGYYPVETAVDWEDSNQEGDATAVRVDGQNAYALQNLRQMDYDGGGPEGATYPTGVSSQEASISQDAAGNITIFERYPLYRCESNAVFPPTSTSCDTVTSAGVRLDRTKTTSDGGATFTVLDDFVSTDGNAHSVHTEYYSAADNDYDYPEYRMPGDASYATYEDADLFAWTFAPASMMWRNNLGEGSYTGAGGITTMQQPDTTTWDSYDEWYTRYNVEVPAGGSSRLEQHYHVAFTAAEVEALAAARRDPLGSPAVTISSPADGSTVRSDSVTVTGTATDNVAVKSLTVNGIPTTLNSDGTWSQHVTLTRGANTITASATDGAGNTGQSAVNVTYTPEAPVVQPEAPRAGVGVAAVRLKSKRRRLRGRRIFLKIACAAGEPQNGTLKLRTTRKPKRTLDTESFQCPGGSTRTVRILLSRREARQLRRLGRQRINVYVVGRDLSGEAGVWRYSFILTP